MAVALVSGTPAYTTLSSGVSSQTWSFNAGTSTSNTCLIIVLSYYYSSGADISSITYNGVSAVHATNAPANNNSYCADIWYLANPATGSNSLVVHFSNNLSFTGMLGAAVFSGVNQTTPLGPGVTSNGGSVSVTIPANGGGVDCDVYTGAAPSSPTQTQLFIDSSSQMTGASQYSLTSGNQTFGWTNINAEIACPINSVPVPATVSISHGAFAFTGEPSHANEVDGIAHAALSFSPRVLHVNQALAIAHAALGLAGEALHVNEVISIAHAGLTLAGKSLTSLGNSVISIAHAVMGFTGRSLSAGVKMLKAIYLNVWSMWTAYPRSRGM